MGKQQVQVRQRKEQHDETTKSSSSCCCTPQNVAFGVSFTITQLLSIFFFAVSAVPYMINFDERVEDFYNFATLDTIKTIWIRIHVFSCTLNLFLGPIQVLWGFLRWAGNSKIHKYMGYTYSVAMVLCVLTSVPLIILRYADPRGEDGNGGGAWQATPLLFLTISGFGKNSFD